MVIGLLAKTPRQFALRRFGAERIAQRDPTATAHTIHQKAIVRGREHQVLVTEQRECRGCTGNRRQELCDVLQLIWRCAGKRWWCVSKQSHQCGDAERAGRTRTGT